MAVKTHGDSYLHRTGNNKIRILVMLLLFSAIILFKSAPVEASTQQYYMHVNNSSPYGATYEELSVSLPGTLAELDSGVLLGSVDATFPEKFMKTGFGTTQNLNGEWYFSVWLKTSGNTMNYVKAWAKVYKKVGTSEILLGTTPSTTINLTTAYVNASWSYNFPSKWINGTDGVVVEYWINVPDVGSGKASNKHILLGYDSTTVNSYVNMTPTPVGSVDITAYSLAPAYEKQGKKAVTVANITFVPSGGTVDVSTVKVYFNGTNKENVRRVYLVDDENNNGEPEPDEIKLDVKYFEEYDNVTFGTAGTSLFNVPEGKTKHVIVVYDLSGSALLAVGDKLGVTIPGGAVTMEYGSVSSDNFPFNSDLTTAVRQEMDEFANVYAFLNKPAYLFARFSKGENSAYDGATTPCKDNVLWPGCDTFIDVTPDNDQDSNTDFMRESTTIRVRALVVDGRGRPIKSQRINIWVITDNGHKINNSDLTDENGTVEIELWGWPDFENTTTSDTKPRFPVHSGQNITLNDTTPITNEAAYIYANFTSRQYYNVYIDADGDGISDSEAAWLAYTMFDTFPIEDKSPDHCEKNYKDIHTTSMVGDGNQLSRNNSDSDAICPDCHGWDYRAGPSKISSGTDVADILKYGVTHPRPGASTAARCDDTDCHTSTLTGDQPIPGYSAGTDVINTASFPDVTICSTSSCHSSTGKAPKYVDDVIPSDGEGHCFISDIPTVKQGAQCKFCHMQNYHFISSRRDIPAFSPPGGDGAYPGTCFEGCHIAIAWHNSSVACQECHFNAATAPMHKRDMRVDRKLCYQSCHGNYSLTSVSSKDNTILSVSRVWLNTTWRHSTELNNGSKWNTSTFNRDTYPGQFYWNNSETGFPQPACEFCHSNEHTGAVFYVRDPMGKLLLFNGRNIQNSEITHTSNWCAGCHYQNYTSDGKDYMDMVLAFINTSLPVPPEISGNVTYGPISGSNPGVNGTTYYIDHSAWFMNNGTSLDYSDAMCFECHANGISINEGHRRFQHNVTIGFGGPLCSSCHNNTLKGITEPGGIPRLDAVSMENTSWDHFNLGDRTGVDKSYVRSIEASCWACHNTSTGGRPASSEHPASYRQPESCTDCHIKGNYSAPVVVEHIPAGYNSSTEIPASTSDYCTVCHNNSLLTYSDMNTTDFASNPNATVAHYSTNMSLMTPINRSRDCVWCHYQNSDSAAWGTPVDPRIALPLHIGKTNTECYNCHVDGGVSKVSSAGWSFHDVSVQRGSSGGANCSQCHDVDQSSPKQGSLVNIAAMGDIDAVHKDLNSGATSPSGYPPENFRCWACHGSGSEPAANDHPVEYNSPKTCEYCHTSGSAPYSALQVSEHYWNSVSINTTDATSCYDCHNASEMMMGLDLDPDGPDNNIYGGANGGNLSVSHYGKKRTDYPLQDTNDYCYKCHNNATAISVWPYSNNANATIANHSMNYPSTNPDCGDCHGTGRIHNSTLYEPVFDLPNSSYCLECHGAGGSASIKNLEQHNDTPGLECTQCHMNTSDSIHPVMYLQHDSSWDTSKTDAVNCTTCHQDSGLGGEFSSAAIIPAVAHSTNTYSGAMWNGTQPGFWDNTSEQSNCDYCHGIGALHNTSGLGKATIARGGNLKNQTLTGGYWCANCHYSGALNYSGDQFTPQPPEVLNSSGLVPLTANDGTRFYDHSGDFATGSDDEKCKSCHDNNLGSDATSLNFVHSLGSGGGGPDCISCHGLSGNLGDGKKINDTAMNAGLSVHKNLNKDASTTNSNYSESKRCWACHGDGTEPGGHPDNYKIPYTCQDCHIQGADQNLNFTPSSILNVTRHYWNGTGVNTTAAGSCHECHNKSEMMLGLDLDPDGPSINIFSGANGGNSSVSHYGKKRTDYPSQDTNEYCYECHKNISATSVWPYSNNDTSTIANHSMNYNSSNPDCKDCHGTGRIHNNTIYKQDLTISNSTYCLNCHGLNVSSGLPNHTGVKTGYKETHNTSLCSECHLNTSKNIHQVQYLQQSGSWSDTNVSVVNCTTCHQGSVPGNFSSAPKVRTPVWHSNNSYSGAMWNGTQPGFWDNTSQLSNCDYCHGYEALHNISGLGKSALIKANNSRNQSLTGGYWCANCHYNGKDPGEVPGGKYEYKGDLFYPVPPEILNLTGLVPANAFDGTPFQNHTVNVGGVWSDERCKSCHGKDLPSGITSAEFLHNLNQSASETGGPDCIPCHASTYNGPDEPAEDMRINVTAFTNYSVHRNINSNVTVTVTLSDNRSKACWACHGDGSQPVKHHADYTSPKPCEFCHVSNNFNSTPVYRHYPGAVFAGSIIYDNSGSNRTCVSCHNNSIVANLNLSFGPNPGKVKNSSVSHYTVNRSMSENNPGVVKNLLLNTTDLKGCQECHMVGGQFGQEGPDYGEAGEVPLAHNVMGATDVDCEDSCHNNNKVGPDITAVNLHSDNVGIYVETNSCYSTGCHTAPPPDDDGRTRR